MVVAGAALPIKKSSGMPRRVCKMKDSAQPSPASSGPRLGYNRVAEQQFCWHETFGHLVVGTRRQGTVSACDEASLQAHSSEVAMRMFLPASQQQQELGCVSLGEERIIWRRGKLENLVNKTLPAGHL